MVTDSAGAPAAAAPGRAAYEAHRTVIAASLGLDLNGSDDFDGPPAAWEALAPSGHAAWDAAAQSAIDTAAPRCPSGCGCRLGTEDADRLDCACDGLCCYDDIEVGEIIAERDRLREDLEGLRDHIDSLALGLDMAARSTAPSKKSEIEAACASALRGLLRIDGESGEETRQRLERERAAHGSGLRALIAEICDALDHGGPYWVERWRERAGLEG